MVGEWEAAKVEFSPDGAALLTTDWSGMVGAHTWRVADGAALYPVKGGSQFYSPDGSLIVSFDTFLDENNHFLGKIYVTNAQDGALVASFQVQPLFVAIGGLTPDSRFFYFVTMDGILHVWGAP